MTGAGLQRCSRLFRILLRIRSLHDLIRVLRAYYGFFDKLFR